MPYLKSQEELAQESFDFGYALNCLKGGRKVRRKVWPAGAFIYLVKPSIVPYANLRNEAKTALSSISAAKDDTVKITAHIDMSNANGSIVIGWIITTNDALSTDWEVIN